MTLAPDLADIKEVAIFDLDRTITRAGTFTPFLLSTRDSMSARLALLARFTPSMALYKAGRLSRKTLKNRMMAMALAGCEHSKISTLADRFVAKILASGIFTDAMAAIAHHRAAGHTLILATASVDFYAQRFAAQLGFDACIASETDHDARKTAPPQIIGENCYGEAKRNMVAAQLDALYGKSRDNLRLSFYTDHISDLPLLETVDAPYVVNPKPALRKHARQAGWAVYSWTV